MTSSYSSAKGHQAPHWIFESALYLVVAVVVMVSLARIQAPELSTGRLVDTDTYMRLVRVTDLSEQGSWFDATVERASYPVGERMHWTRPLDVLVLGPTMLLDLWMPFASALLAVAIAIGPVILVATGFVLSWAIRPLITGDLTLVAKLAVLAQPALVGYAVGGRVDHHALLFLLFAVVVGLAVRLFVEPDSRSFAYWLGAFVALGLWVSTEFLVVEAILVVGGVAAWIYNSKHLGGQSRLAASTAIGISLAVLLERGPGGLAQIELDRISIAHSILAVLVLGFWVGIRLFNGVVQRTTRLVYSVVAGTVAVLLMALFIPGFFRGPWGEVDHLVAELWLTRVSELQPLWPRAAADIGRLVALLGVAIVAIPLVALIIARHREPVVRIRWLTIAVLLAVYLPLALRYFRFAPYAELLGVVVVLGILPGVLARVARIRSGPTRAMTSAALKAAAVTGFFLISATVSATTGGPEEGPPPAECDLKALSTLLNDPQGYGRQPTTILAVLDFGSELLFRTKHRVTVTPIGDNDAILDSYWALAGTDMKISAAILIQRQVDMIVLCPEYDEVFFGSHRGSLRMMLLNKTLPAWATELDLPRNLARFRIFSVDRSALSGST